MDTASLLASGPSTQHLAQNQELHTKKARIEKHPKILPGQKRRAATYRVYAVKVRAA